MNVNVTDRALYVGMYVCLCILFEDLLKLLIRRWDSKSAPVCNYKVFTSQEGGEILTLSLPHTHAYGETNSQTDIQTAELNILTYIHTYKCTYIHIYI